MKSESSKEDEASFADVCSKASTVVVHLRKVANDFINSKRSFQEYGRFFACARKIENLLRAKKEFHERGEILEAVKFDPVIVVPDAPLSIASAISTRLDVILNDQLASNVYGLRVGYQAIDARDERLRHRTYWHFRLADGAGGSFVNGKRFFSENARSRYLSNMLYTAAYFRQLLHREFASFVVTHRSSPVKGEPPFFDDPESLFSDGLYLGQGDLYSEIFRLKSRIIDAVLQQGRPVLPEIVSSFDPRQNSYVRY